MLLKKYRPAREQLAWIPIYLSVLSVISTIIVVYTHRFFPEYTLKYITIYSHTAWKLYGLYFVTLISIVLFVYYRKLGATIVETGERHRGTIVEVIWKRAFLCGCEWKCRLVVKAENGNEYNSPYYKYDFLNYLDDVNCTIYVLGGKCYLTDFTLVDRSILPEMKKKGLYGGSYQEGKNNTPFFPIMTELRVTKKGFEKSYKSATQRGVLGILIVAVAVFSAYASAFMFVPSFSDSDGDGLTDDDEFEMGTDPTVYDESFLFVERDSLDGVTVEYRVQLPTPCDYRTILDLKVGFERYSNMRYGTIAGYIVNPFYVSPLPENAEAEVVITFDEKLLSKPNFYPQICRFSMDHQEVGMIEVPCKWEAQSNVISVDFNELSKIGREWKFYFLDGYEWNAWYDSYTEFWENNGAKADHKQMGK